MNNGDMILTKRFAEFYPENSVWNDEPITDNMIRAAIEAGMPEVSTPFGNEGIMSEQKNIADRPDEWHIGRIIYFINHPEEIKDIWIDNECYHSRYPRMSCILPKPKFQSKRVITKVIALFFYESVITHKY